MSSTGSRHQRGSLELKRRGWVLRVRVDVVDPRTGTATRPHRHLHVGTLDDLPTREQARIAADALVERVNAAPGSIRTRTTAVSRYLTLYEQQHLPRYRPATQASTRTAIRRHLRPAWAGLRLDQVTVTQVQHLVDQLAANGLARSTILLVLKAWQRIARAACDDGYAVDPLTLRDVSLQAARAGAVRNLLPRHRGHTDA